MKRRIVSTGSALNSPAFYKRKRVRRRAALVLLTLASIIILGTIITFFRMERFLLSGVVIAGENISDSESLKLSTEDVLSGSYLWLLPRSHFLIYPRSAIKDSLLLLYPRVKSVDLNLEGTKMLAVEVEERVSDAVYCDNSVGTVSSQTSSDRCYLVDGSGFVFATVGDLPDDKIIYSLDAEMPNNPLGSYFIASNEYQVIKDFVRTFVQIGIDTASVGIGDDEYHFTMPSGGSIIWKRGKDFESVRSDLEAFLSSEVIKSQEDFLEKVLYIDLRVDNKVFYKFKESVL